MYLCCIVELSYTFLLLVNIRQYPPTRHTPVLKSVSTLNKEKKGLPENGQSAIIGINRNFRRQHSPEFESKGAPDEFMNDKFFSLPEEKQWKIINAGFRIFAHNSYKKAPVGEIAAEAGISKSLLFHYFHNKKEFYFFLWKKAAEITFTAMDEYKCYEPEDLFEAMYRGMYAKIKIMKEFPDLGIFAIRSFYEKDSEVAGEVQEIYAAVKSSRGFGALTNMDLSKFRDDLDLDMMQREMFLASEGYLWELLQRNVPLEPERIEKDFTKLLEFWKSVYYREDAK